MAAGGSGDMPPKVEPQVLTSLLVAGSSPQVRRGWIGGERATQHREVRDLSQNWVALGGVFLRMTDTTDSMVITDVLLQVYPLLSSLQQALTPPAVSISSSSEGDTYVTQPTTSETLVHKQKPDRAQRR